MKLIGLLLAVCMAWAARGQEAAPPFMRSGLLLAAGRTTLPPQFYVFGLLAVALSYGLVRLIMHKRRADHSHYETPGMRSRHYAYWVAASASLIAAGSLVGWFVFKKPALNFAGYVGVVALHTLGIICGVLAYRASKTQVLDPENPVARAIVKMGREKGFRVRQVVVVESPSCFARRTLGATVEVGSSALQTLGPEEAAAFVVYRLGIKDNAFLHNFLVAMTILAGQTVAKALNPWAWQLPFQQPSACLRQPS